MLCDAQEELVRAHKYTLCTILDQKTQCVFWKHLSDGTRMNMVMYVDDGYVTDTFSAAAETELAKLHAAFTIALKPAH